MILRHEDNTVQHSAPDAPRNGGRLLWLDSCASTNAEVLSGAYDAVGVPFALATFDQRAGRGRQGRTWVNRPGDSLAFSMVWEPTLELPKWPWYSLVASQAVVETIAEFEQAAGKHGEPVPAEVASAPGDESVQEERGEIGVKWPNDVIDARGHKLSGILAEIHGNRLVVGIGVNLARDVDRETSGLERAVSLAEIRPDCASALRDESGRKLFAKILFERVNELFAALELGGSQSINTQARYAVNCLTVGRHVEVEILGTGQRYEALARRISEHGGLIVENSERGEHEVLAADVHLVASKNQ